MKSSFVRVRFSDGKMRRVPLIDPMRPVETDEIPTDGWVAEEKIDGALSMMYLVDGAVAFLNRRGVNKTQIYPELTDDERYVGKGLTILQGEVHTAGGGTDSFARLLRRELLQDPSKAKERAKDIPLRYTAFDLLMKGGEWQVDRPYVERKAELRRVAPKTKEVGVARHSFDTKGFTAKLKRKRAAEGVVYKKSQSSYTSGRSREWLKKKFKKTADTVILGYESGEGRREAIGALRVGVWQGGGLKEVGRVGTGFTDKELLDIKRRLDGGEQLFARVAYLSRGSKGRLRMPVFGGLRDDLVEEETHV